MGLHWLILILALLPQLLAAQGRVLSGEHDGFTRLVAPIPPGGDWQLSQEGRTLRFRSAGLAERYLLDGVFDLIPRARIAEIGQAEEGFVATLGCDCMVTSWLAEDRFVVIDVSSPGPETAANTPATQRPPSRLRLPLLPEPAPDLAVIPRALPLRARQPLTEAEQRALDEVQQRLARQLGVAATRGLVDPVPGARLAAPADASAPLPEAPDKVAQVAEPPPLTNNLRITSSMDFPSGMHASPPGPSLSGLGCPENAALDISGWSDGRALHPQLGEIRRDLYQEFDRLNPEAALRMVRLYLHFGFGAEALQVLALDSEVMGAEHLLADIARIMEHGQAPPGSRLPLLVDCETDVALWAMLAQEELSTAHRPDTRAALLGLNRLPAHLRAFLAPALSDRLRTRGDSEGAAAALRSVERLSSAPGTALRRAQGELAIEEGAVEEGTEKLQAVVAANAEQSPEALIALVDARLAAGQPISPEVAGLIEAYERELGGGPLGPDLRRVQVLALAKARQFDAAFAAMAALGPSEVLPALRDAVLQDLTATGSDMTFLDHLFQTPPADIVRLPLRTRLDIATRLVALGFAVEADRLLSDIPDRPLDPRRQLLAARIALALDQPSRARAALGELTGEEAALLRAEATREAGDYALAEALFLQADQPGDAVEAAWLAPEQDGRAAAGDPLFGPVLGLAGSDLSLPPGTEGMIARSGALLAESAEARRKLSELLAAPRLDAGSLAAVPER